MPPPREGHNDLGDLVLVLDRDVAAEALDGLVHPAWSSCVRPGKERRDYRPGGRRDLAPTGARPAVPGLRPDGRDEDAVVPIERRGMAGLGAIPIETHVEPAWFTVILPRYGFQWIRAPHPRRKTRMASREGVCPPDRAVGWCDVRSGLG